jgi:ATP adenylyltransferase
MSSFEKKGKNMNKLWAPWRIGYITHKKPLKCIFCQQPKKKKQDKKNFVIKRTKNAFSLLNIFPYNNGHLLVAPYKHVKDLRDLNREEILELMDLVKEALNLLDKKLKPQGYNIGLNLGRIAGAGFDQHIHIHIVPRWKGDTNFMSVINDTKVIAQSLKELYKILVHK